MLFAAPYFYLPPDMSPKPRNVMRGALPYFFLKILVKKHHGRSAKPKM
jgi:hypothetical protein